MVCRQGELLGHDKSAMPLCEVRGGMRSSGTMNPGTSATYSSRPSMSFAMSATMPCRNNLPDLIARVESAPREDNSLDVLCEVALFKPSSVFTAIRANAAGTKVIYTDRAGNQVTCWAEPWSVRKETPALLAARLKQEMQDG